MFSEVLSYKTGQRKYWVLGTVISLGLLGLVLSQIDFSVIAGMVDQLHYPALLAAFVLLCLEGVFTALRIWVFAARKPCVSQALKANAWYVLLLVMLPARLGEAAAVLVFKKYLGQGYGAAAMSIISQRLYDVVILSVFFLLALMGLSDALDMGVYGVVSFGVIIVALIFLLRMTWFLSMMAGFLKAHNRYRRRPVLKKIMRLILQARLWNRRVFSKRDIVPALLFTVLKWVSNLGALVFLFVAIGLDLSIFEAVATAGAYNFLAIIPLQTVGGIGVGEAGLTALLMAMGLSVSIAASASIMIRLVIIVFPFIFWAMVMGALRLKEKVGV